MPGEVHSGHRPEATPHLQLPWRGWTLCPPRDLQMDHGKPPNKKCARLNKLCNQENVAQDTASRARLLLSSFSNRKATTTTPFIFSLVLPGTVEQQMTADSWPRAEWDRGFSPKPVATRPSIGRVARFPHPKEPVLPRTSHTAAGPLLLPVLFMDTRTPQLTLASQRVDSVVLDTAHPTALAIPSRWELCIASPFAMEHNYRQGITAGVLSRVPG